MSLFHCCRGVLRRGIPRCSPPPDSAVQEEAAAGGYKCGVPRIQVWCPQNSQNSEFAYKKRRQQADISVVSPEFRIRGVPRIPCFLTQRRRDAKKSTRIPQNQSALFLCVSAPLRLCVSSLFCLVAAPLLHGLSQAGKPAPLISQDPRRCALSCEVFLASVNGLVYPSIRCLKTYQKGAISCLAFRLGRTSHRWY